MTNTDTWIYGIYNGIENKLIEELDYKSSNVQIKRDVIDKNK
jgi:hypothetical protein